jgi:hypothetical protein
MQSLIVENLKFLNFNIFFIIIIIKINIKAKKGIDEND